MPGKWSSCPHVVAVGQYGWEDLKEKQQNERCHACDSKSNNLWLCLISNCQSVGCGESVKDHSSLHAEIQRHCLTVNLATLRIWCYSCETEVYPGRNTPQFLIPDKVSKPPIVAAVQRPFGSYADGSPQRSISTGDDSESDFEDDSVKPRGLTGLQNLGNTCYLNSALQSLANCPPLTRFFLDCPGFVYPDKNPMLSKFYLKLVNEIWHRRRSSYVIPSGVVHGIKVVHPMFRGYSQQDTQEFLRCFMDQIHEELKHPIVDDEQSDDGSDELLDPLPVNIYVNSQDRQSSVDSSSSQSEGGYDTCESRLSTEGTTADHGTNSGDEGGDITEHSKLKPITVQTISHGDDQGSPSLKVGSGDGPDSDSIISSKQTKEAAKLLFKQTADIRTDKNTKSESVSVQDVNSMAEPGQSVKVKPMASVSPTRISTNTEVPHQRKSHPPVNYRPKQASKNIQYQSIISDIFDGRILSSVQCLTCERISTNKETFQDLSLPIPSKDHLQMLHTSHSPGSKSGACGEANEGWFSWMYSIVRSWFVGPNIRLQDCLAAFFSADELKGDNMYSCEKCKKLRNGVKYVSVLELSEVLCIHLKRFRHEFYSASKIGSYVSFPLENLDMKQYLHKDCKNEVTQYDLIAVICHHGTAGGGHYTAFCLNHINELWYEFDDQYVTEVDVGQVMSCQAYVLFYRKKNDRMLGVRQKAMDLMDSREPSLLQFFISKQWINRFNTFAEPGPITNKDFLCKHGGVPPHLVSRVDELVVPLNQCVWKLLHERFGGGPVCNHLYACSMCQVSVEALRNRQQSELECFIELNEKFRDEENPSIIFAISMTWFKDWENFVRGKTDVPPGLIENERISSNKSGRLIVKPNSDHGQLSREMWHFLSNIYGGGPELVLRQNTNQCTAQASISSPLPPTAVDDRVSEEQENIENTKL